MQVWVCGKTFGKYDSYPGVSANFRGSSDEEVNIFLIVGGCIIKFFLVSAFL